MSAQSGSAFTPISPNPFIVGNPIRDRAMFYGREAEFDIVRRRFKESPEEGGLLVFCGERRSGKTSILFQILNGRLGGDFIPVLVDMQSMAIDDEVGFLRRITDDILSGLGPEGKTFAPPDYTGSKPAATFQRFVGDVLKVHPAKKLILLIDEYELLENKIDGGVLTPDVLLILSHLMENLAVFLIFTGSVTLEERKRDYWLRFLSKSSFRKISFLERKDALRLITEPVKDRVEWQPGVVDRIFRLTGGQPFYTQGICQGVVDHLNEHETMVASPEVVEAVVRDIVDNPFPQMLFRWDTLKNDEKLVLSLMAETLERDTDYVPAAKVQDFMRRRRYPLDLNGARIAAALESLFESDMLVKDDANPPGYAYKMDLWRRWVRRMHSVWQVLRELGMKVRHRPGRLRPVLLGVAALAVVAVGAVSLATMFRGGGNSNPPVPPALASLDLNVTPDSAAVEMDEEYLGRGTFKRLTPAAGNRSFRVYCAGYEPQTFDLTLTGGEPFSYDVVLVPLQGAVRVEVRPPGAMVSVDGGPPRPAPAVVEGLAVPNAHRLGITAAGYKPVERPFTVFADSLLVLRVDLNQETVDVLVSTNPPGARVSMDGRPQSELLIRGVPLGKHTFRAELAGYLPAEAQRDITPTNTSVSLTLEPEPPGALTLRGGSEARMKVDNSAPTAWLPTFTWKDLRPGAHTVWIQLRSGEERTRTVTVPSGRLVVFNYMTMEVESETQWNSTTPPSAP